jgi:hypothetical protein
MKASGTPVKGRTQSTCKRTLLMSHKKSCPPEEMVHGTRGLGGRPNHESIPGESADVFTVESQSRHQVLRSERISSVRFCLLEIKRACVRNDILQIEEQARDGVSWSEAIFARAEWDARATQARTPSSIRSNSSRTGSNVHASQAYDERKTGKQKFGRRGPSRYVSPWSRPSADVEADLSSGCGVE